MTGGIVDTAVMLFSYCGWQIPKRNECKVAKTENVVFKTIHAVSFQIVLATFAFLILDFVFSSSQDSSVLVCFDPLYSSIALKDIGDAPVYFLLKILQIFIFHQILF